MTRSAFRINRRRLLLAAVRAGSGAAALGVLGCGRSESTAQSSERTPSDRFGLTSLPERTSVVIIGAGLAGLRAARDLRDAGIDTVVLEV